MIVQAAPGKNHDIENALQNTEMLIVSIMIFVTISEFRQQTLLKIQEVHSPLQTEI